MDSVRLETIYDQHGILTMLRYSREHRATIGIHSPALGGGIYITTIENIVLGEETEIVLKNYDSSGNILDTNKLKLTDIRCVFPFQPAFENPYIKDFHRQATVCF
jgi:hypothetical protein